VQFKSIPVYLLSKELARTLGRKIGSLISIDNNARGDICDKIIRAWINLPIDRALQGWIPLIDGKTGEDVIAYIHYERLPTCCLFCGLIGHSEVDCGLLGDLRKKRYN
jgi:hypothetical protein